MKGRDREKDMRILAGMFFQNLEQDDMEYGGWGLDGKRPFGNSDVEGDILDELPDMEPEAEDGSYSEEQAEYAAELYSDLGPWLQKQWASKWESI
jgi:hypothetical protein